MAGTGSKVKLGAAWVYFGTVAGPVGEILDLGYTKGGITFRMDTTIREITVDQEGTSPIGATILGRRVTVTVPLAETNYTRLQKLVPESTFSDSLFEIASGLGGDMLDYADELLIQSKQNAQDYIKVYKAIPAASLNATFSPDGERIWPVEFTGMIPDALSIHAGILAALHEAT